MVNGTVLNFGKRDMKMYSDMSEGEGHGVQLPYPQILADQKAPPDSGGAPHYYLPPGFLTLAACLDLKIIFDQWPKLYIGFDAEPESRIYFKVNFNFYLKGQTDVLNFYPPKSCFRILISYLESKSVFRIQIQVLEL